jgi:hypothetical protein
LVAGRKRLGRKQKGPQACRLRPWLWMKLLVSYMHTLKPQALLKKRKLKKKKKRKRSVRFCMDESILGKPSEVNG